MNRCPNCHGPAIGQDWREYHRCVVREPRQGRQLRHDESEVWIARPWTHPESRRGRKPKAGPAVTADAATEAVLFGKEGT